MQSFRIILLTWVIGLVCLNCGSEKEETEPVVEKEFNVGILDIDFPERITPASLKELFPDRQNSLDRDDFALEQPSHADPNELLTVLQDEGIKTRIVNETDFAVPETLTVEETDVMVLPYGTYFPLEARDRFIDFLKQGGAFISMGGYAFDDLIEKKEGRWMKANVDDPKQYLSGRRGEPGDWVKFQPEQIVIFDPTYPFKRANKITTDSQTPLFMDSQTEDIQLEGFPATAMTGNNSPVFAKPFARWYPILTAKDRYDRPRGSVMSLVLHHDGPYDGSAWAFSGVSNVNLFSASHPIMMDSLKKTLRAMEARTFLVDVQKESNESEGYTIKSRVANKGWKKQSVKVTLIADNTEIGFKTVDVKPGETVNVAQSLPADNVKRDYTPIAVELVVSGVFKDRLETGIIKPSENKPIRSTFIFQENYFRVNSNPKFLMGTNQTGMIWFSPHENPATWERDLQRMRDAGLSVLRVIHISPFAGQGYEGKGHHTPSDLAGNPPEELLQRADELVAMCARHNIKLIFGLIDWQPIELTDEQLKAQQSWCQFWAERYKNEPHVIFDIQNEPHLWPNENPRNNEFWNAYLRKTYGDDEALKAAWGIYAPTQTIGQIPCKPGPDKWDNPRRFEYNRFRAWLLQRWVKANFRAIKEGSPDSLVTVGFLQNEWQADKWLPVKELSFVNTHFHGPIERFSPVLKLIDRRFAGQGLGLGEFGAWDAHEARKVGQLSDESEASAHHFMAVLYETFGMGGAYALNWNLKDLNNCVFPWGLYHAQDRVPKDWLKVYRNTSLALSSLKPKYQDPDVYLLLPDNHRLGAQSGRIHQALHNSVRLMMGAHINFNVINEGSIQDLPRTARTIIWPIPYCPDDEVFDRVRYFVEHGGNLLITGDFTFDAMRRPNRNHRFTRMGLPPRKPRPPFENQITPAPMELIKSQVGNGWFYFMPKPVEFMNFEDLNWNPYADFLEAVQEKTIPVRPDDPNLHIHSIPQENGNTVYTMFNSNQNERPMNYRLELSEDSSIRFSLKGKQAGMIEKDNIGNVLTVSGYGTFRTNRSPLVLMNEHVTLKSLDYVDLMNSSMVLIAPNTIPAAGRGARLRIWNKMIEFPVLTIGEIANGDWKTYEEIEIQKRGDVIPINLDGDQATSLMLLTSRGLSSAAAQTLVSLVNQ